MEFYKSPLYYTGNKYLLLKQIYELFPTDRKIFIDAFGGSGVVAINVACNNQYKQVQYNEIQKYVFDMFIYTTKIDKNELLTEIKLIIKNFYLEQTYKITETEMKKIFYEYRNYVNNIIKDSNKDFISLNLYVLSYFSFMNTIRFNKNGFTNNTLNKPSYSFDKIDATAGNRFFSESKFNERMKYRNYLKQEIIKTNLSYEKIEINNPTETFIYIDPPYANTGAGYNKEWDLTSDKKLFEYLETLTKNGVKWGMSNVLRHNGVVNIHIKEWVLSNNLFMRKLYKKYTMGKKSAKDQHSGMETDEVYISNYSPETPEQLKLFEMEEINEMPNM